MATPRYIWQALGNTIVGESPVEKVPEHFYTPPTPTWVPSNPQEPETLGADMIPGQSRFGAPLAVGPQVRQAFTSGLGVETLETPDLGHLEANSGKYVYEGLVRAVDSSATVRLFGDAGSANGVYLTMRSSIDAPWVAPEAVVGYLSTLRIITDDGMYEETLAQDPGSDYQSVEPRIHWIVDRSLGAVSVEWGVNLAEPGGVVRGSFEVPLSLVGGRVTEMWRHSAASPPGVLVFGPGGYLFFSEGTEVPPPITRRRRIRLTPRGDTHRQGPVGAAIGSGHRMGGAGYR